MKNWKKLLACLLVGLMALTVFTACDASVGAPMSPKRSTAESAKALCDTFKGVTYDKELSEKAYLCCLLGRQLLSVLQGQSRKDGAFPEEQCRQRCKNLPEPGLLRFCL